MEFNIRKKKWLPFCSYNTHKINIVVDFYLKHYDNALILADVNSELKDKVILISKILKALAKNRIVLKTKTTHLR